MDVNISLLEKHAEVSEADIPLPLAAVDTERERLIFEKDEEVCFSLFSLFSSLTHLSMNKGNYCSFIYSLL